MHEQKRSRGQVGTERRVHEFRRLVRRRYLVSFWGALLAFALTCEGRSEPPSAAGFPELADACRPIGSFVFGNTILAGGEDAANTCDADRSCEPFPAKSRMLAYEENNHFICAVGDGSRILAPPQAAPGEFTFIRRLIFLRPSIFVVDDVVSRRPSVGPLRWLLYCRNTPTVTDGHVSIADGDRELVCQTLRPSADMPKQVRVTGQREHSVYEIDVQPQASAKQVRWLHVAHVRPAGVERAAVKSVVTENGGVCKLTITTADRVFRLDLPVPGAAAGHVAIQDASGKTLVSRRPLPGGVLPHGPPGVRLIERWDSRYRDGRTPPWDTGTPAADLKQAVEQGDVRPCRTVVLGCGSGTNAIYLAGKGFDVTAIDIAPTALSIAEAKAEKAGVRVRWVLADVLALPDLGAFDFVFDRGCYHNVRYVDAKAFVESVRGISRPGTRCLILSLNRDGPPGVREKTMRDDFSSFFEFEWLRESGIRTGKDGQTRRASWSLMLRRKDDGS